MHKLWHNQFTCWAELCNHFDFKDEPGFTAVASLEEIRAKEGNLSIPLYIAPSASMVREESATYGGESLETALTAWLESSKCVRNSFEELLETGPKTRNNT